MEQLVHRGKNVVEFPDGCMILFTNHKIHVGHKIHEKQSDIYSSHLRMFAYIVEQDYVQTIDCITKLLNDDRCI